MADCTSGLNRWRDGPLVEADAEGPETGKAFGGSIEGGGPPGILKG